MSGCLAGVAFGQAAGNPPPSEYDIKAVFLYHFTRYVAWPEDAPAEAVSIVVFGESEITAPLLEIAKKKTVGPKPLFVRQCLDPAQIGRPQILFIAKSKTARLAQILKETEGTDILTVGEAAGLARAQGVAINFVLQDNAVRFEISEKAVSRTRLKIGSQLLKLAILVDAPEGKTQP